MSTTASQITNLTIVYSTVHSDADQRKPQSSASLAFVRGIHRWSLISSHKGPITGKMFPCDDVIMVTWKWDFARSHINTDGWSTSSRVPDLYIPLVSVPCFMSWCIIMTSSDGNIFCVTGPFERNPPVLTKVSDTELWYFLWSAPEQMVEQPIEGYSTHWSSCYFPLKHS